MDLHDGLRLSEGVLAERFLTIAGVLEGYHRKSIQPP